VDGSIEVVSIVSAASPVFDPPAGAYIGPLQVTIATITTGATIHFTTDGSDPATSPTAVSAPAPVSGIEVSAPGTLTLRAYASKDGIADSTATTATYQTLPADGLIWTNPAGGSWPVTGNWLHGLVANGSGHVARFDTLTLVASPTVNLDTSPVVGGMVFGDVGNQHPWILASGSGGPLTLATPSGIPFIGVNNGSLTVSAVLAGSQGMLKDGPGILALTGPNTFTGGTLLRAGEVRIDKRGALGNGPVTLGDAQSGAAEIRLLQRGSDPWPPTDSWCENDITVAAGATGRVVIGRQNAGTYAANFTGTITLQNNMIFRNFGNDRLSIEGKITGTGNIVIEGSGRVNWNHPGNDFLGTITVAAGAIFQPNHPASVPATTAVTLHGNMGTNIATGETMTIGALHGNGNIYRLASGNPTLAIGANDADGSFGGAIQNDFSVTKTGAGIQTFSGTHTYTGPTAVNGGTLLINGSLAGGATTVAAAATLGGSGTLGGPVSNSGTLAPGGNGVGNLTITNTLTLAGGSNLAWEISDWTGSAGAGWDKITATSLNLTATTANRVTIKPSDLAPAHFSETSQTFVIVQTTSGISGFSADIFTVDTTGLTVPQGTWAVQQSGSNLVLAYTAFNPDANGNGILDTWEIEKFGHANQGANPPDGDPEGDGLTNLMEYALDTDPLAATTNPIVHDLVPPGHEQFLRLTIPKNPAATNLTYIVETCGALNDWSSANTTIEADTATQLIVRDNFTTATAARRFIRLKVISTTP
jgi:autotransporter-associated beta strand protein